MGEVPGCVRVRCRDSGGCVMGEVLGFRGVRDG